MKTSLTCILFLLLAGSADAKTSAIMEESRTYMLVAQPHSLVVREFRRIKIMDENGYEFAVYRDYYNSFKKIRNLQYTVFDANNKRVKRFSKADALDVMVSPSYEVSDARMVIVDPEYRNFPFTIEIEVESSHDGFLNFEEWMPRFTYDLEVKNAELILECFREFQFKSREFNGIAEPVVSEAAKTRIIRWTIKDLAAIEKHISYKLFAADQPKVHLTPLTFVFGDTSGDFSKWSHFGDWYWQLNKDRNKLTAPTQEFLTGLRKQHGDNTEAISKAVYRYMQAKTRYISIQLGIGGFQSIPSDEVERTGYGDCKALTNYMGAMLNFLNITSNHVLVRAGRDVPDILADFPSNQFNHVFLAVPLKSDTLWFECTSQTLPPAYIGTFTDDRHVLWIDKNRSKVIRTPEFLAEESVKASTCVVSLNTEGDADLQVLTIQRGMFFDEAMYYENLPQDKIRQLNYRRFHYPDFSIQSFNLSFPEKDKPVMALNYKLRINGLGKSLGTKYILAAIILEPLGKTFSLDLMNKKAEIRRAFTLVDSVQILAPDNYRFTAVPEDITQVSEFGNFEMRFEKSGDNVLNVYRKAVIKKGRYEDAAFGKFHEMVQKIKSIEQRKIVLTSKT